MKASDINPKKNPAFSKRLYNWCKREGGELYIFRHVDSGFPFYGSLYIGKLNRCHPDYFTGSRIANICRGERVSFSYIGLGPRLEPRPDLEDAYLRIGRCAFDPDYTVPFIDERWDYPHGVFRTCKWCGLKQVMKTKTVQTTSWETVR